MVSILSVRLQDGNTAFSKAMTPNSAAQTQIAARPNSIQTRFFVIFIVELSKGIKPERKALVSSS